MSGRSNPMQLDDAEGATVGLNIGGIRFLTTKTTLTQGDTNENYFSALLSGRFNNVKDEKGYFFIDRNGRYFEPLLDYLRTGQWYCPEDISEDRVLAEARYYCIDVDNVSLSDRRLADLVMKSRDAYHSQVWGNNQHMLETARNLVVESLKLCASQLTHHRRRLICTPFYIPESNSIAGTLRSLPGGHALERYNSLPSSRAQCFCSMNDTAFKVLQSLGRTMEWYLKVHMDLSVRVERQSVVWDKDDEEMRIDTDVEDPLQMLIRAYRVVWTGGDVYGVPSGSASKTRD